MRTLCAVAQLSARKALDKISEWQSAAGQMKPHLPSGDEVLAFWYKYLNEFKKDLPLLHKLSNDALKVLPACIGWRIVATDLITNYFNYYEGCYCDARANVVGCSRVTGRRSS